MFFFRLLSKLMLVGYLVVMGWLAWDILLVTPHPGGRFEQLLLAGTVIVFLPAVIALVVRRPGALTFFNVLIGTALWMLAGILWILLRDHVSTTAMCQAVQAGQNQMIPQIGAWVSQHLGL